MATLKLPIMDFANRQVMDIFRAFLNRDATPMEMSQLRNKGYDHIRDVCMTELQNSEKYKKMENLKSTARSAPKVDGVSLVSTYNKKCGIATYTENLYRELKNHIKTNVISSRIRDRADPSDESGVVPAWDIDTVTVLDDIVNAASALGNKIIHIQHEFGIFRDNESLKVLISMLRGAGFKVIVTMHTIYEQKHWDEYFTGANVVVLHTESAASRLYGHGVNNITVIKHGTVAVQNLGGHKDKRATYRKEMKYIKVEPDDILCVSVGFLTRSKLQHHTMMAMREACRRVPNLKCLLIGHANIRRILHQRNQR
jgi:glycosyltransferase involved in cell wall biosynthesis